MGKKEELSREAFEQALRFKYLVNEFRISVFSPEIKTREPVSPKKLDQQWRLTLAKC
jgi:ATP-dependent helicase HrpA